MPSCASRFLACILATFPLSAAAEAQLDQINEIYSGSGPEARAGRMLAQTFTVGVTGTLAYVDMWLWDSGRPASADLVVEIRATEEGLPQAGVLAQVILGADDVQDANARVYTRVDFTSASLAVADGDVLAIVLRSIAAADPGGYDWWGNGDPSDGVYSRGNGFQSLDAGLTWEQIATPDWDYMFKTYVLTSEPYDPPLLEGSFAINVKDGPIGPFGPTEPVTILATVKNISETQSITLCEGVCVGDEFTYSLGAFASAPDGYQLVFGNGGDTSSGFLNGQVAGALAPQEEKVFVYGIYTPTAPVEPGWYPFRAELQIFAATADRPRLSTPEIGGRWQVLGPEALLALLLEEVAGVGPGRSLVDKVEWAQAYLAANDIVSACAVLGAFKHQLEALTRTKVDSALAQDLIADADVIRSALGCHSAH